MIRQIKSQNCEY